MKWMVIGGLALVGLAQPGLAQELGVGQESRSPEATGQVTLVSQLTDVRPLMNSSLPVPPTLSNKRTSTPAISPTPTVKSYNGAVPPRLIPCLCLLNPL